MKARITVAIAFFAAAVASAQQQPALVDALDGVDTVILLKEGKEVFGNTAFRSERGRFAYLFSSAENKAVFDKTPEKYEIQMGGLCARMGKTVTGNPSDYLVHDGKIYIFGSDNCHKAFAAEPAKFLPKPPAAMPRDAASRTRGQALLDKAAAAIGPKLDTIASYVEMTSDVQKRPSGEVKITIRQAWSFADGARTERTMTRPDGQTVSFGTLLTSRGAWSIGGGEARPVIPEGVASVQLDLGRPIVPLLRARREAGTLVAALGKDTVSGAAVERVRVQRGGLDVIVNIDPATSRVHSTTFIDRNRDGQFGEFTVLYSDFRPADGLVVPFEERALFNGAPEAALSRKLDTISVDGTIDPALFKAGR